MSRRMLLALLIVGVVVIGFCSLFLINFAAEDLRIDEKQTMVATKGAAKVERSPNSSSKPTAIEVQVAPTEHEKSKTASLILQFEDSTTHDAVPRVRVALVSETSRILHSEKVSDMDGLVSFLDLEPGEYRWQVRSSHKVQMNPPYEEESIMKVDGGFQLNQIPSTLSGVVRLGESEEVRFRISVQSFSGVVGALSFEGLPISGKASVKLLTREILGDDPTNQVDRVVARQHQFVDHGRFAFKNVQPGSMEIIVMWQDGQGRHRYLSHRFDLPQGTRRDVGDLPFRIGLTARLLIRPVAIDGATIAISTLLPTRMMMVEPKNPQLDWTYAAKRFPINEEFAIGGLSSGDWFLSEVGQEEFEDSEWKRLSSKNLAFSADHTDLQLLDEVYLRRVSRDLTIDLPEEAVGMRIDVAAFNKLDGSVTRSSLQGVSQTSTCTLQLTEGPHEFFIMATKRNSEVAFCDDRLVQLDLDDIDPVQFSLRPASWLVGDSGSSKAGEPVLSLMLSPAHLAKEKIWIFKHGIPYGSRFRVPVPPGDIRVKGLSRVIVLRPGEILDLGDLQLKRSNR